MKYRKRSAFESFREERRVTSFVLMLIGILVVVAIGAVITRDALGIETP